MTSAPEGSTIQSDFYSPAINKKNIKPGTILYKTDGHVAVVYEVTPQGDVLFMDSHPDNSLSRGLFNPAYVLDKISHGGNFKNFRPFKFDNPVINQKGEITGGNFRFAKDQEISFNLEFNTGEFSLEQYSGNTNSKPGEGSVFKYKPTDLVATRFHEWVKMVLSEGLYKLDPIKEMKNEVNGLCKDAQDRVAVVDVAIQNRTHLDAHPSVYPNNIYGASGTWETYSSPGRDLRFRTKILGLTVLASDWLNRLKSGDSIIAYNGLSLKNDLIAAYKASVETCNINYKNSQGQSIALNLKQLISRAYNMSFDPYMCPEIRWGANTAAEISTCPDDANKKEWHKLTQFLRNDIKKNTDAVHSFTIEDLRKAQFDNSRETV